MKTYQRIASLLEAIEHCRKMSRAIPRHIPHYDERIERHRETLARIMRETAPSGSGFDDGTALLESSDATRLVFSTSFYHLNERGCYDGWTKHQVTVKPSFTRGYDLRVTGRNRNGIKEYIAETFSIWLNTECKE